VSSGGVAGAPRLEARPRRRLFRERRDRAAQLDGVHGHREVQLESRRAQGVAVVVRARQRERRNVAAALRRWSDLRTTTK